MGRRGERGNEWARRQNRNRRLQTRRRNCQRSLRIAPCTARDDQPAAREGACGERVSRSSSSWRRRSEFDQPHSAHDPWARAEGARDRLPRVIHSQPPIQRRAVRSRRTLNKLRDAVVHIEFTLRHSGAIRSYTKTNVHEIRKVFEGQLADLWSRDLRLKSVDPAKIQSFVRSARFRCDVRQQEKGETVGNQPEGIHGYHEVRACGSYPS